jgi:hypothetical protein
MAPYKENHARAGEIVNIFCKECDQEVTGRIQCEMYWGYDNAVAELMGIAADVVVEEPEDYLVIKDSDGMEHEGKEA